MLQIRKNVVVSPNLLNTLKTPELKEECGNLLPQPAFLRQKIGALRRSGCSRCSRTLQNDDDFNKLTESIRQAGQIKKGKQKPSRKFEFSPDVREKMLKSQNEFNQTESQNFASQTNQIYMQEGVVNGS